MSNDFETIVNDINNHLTKSGRRYYSDFYVGITNNADRRLFIEHNVSKENAWWIYRTAPNSEIARRVENHFIKKGMRGGNGGGDNTSNIVYCYAVGPTTIE